ncbi:MAG: LCP family protein [Oscillospiraceae bacterium]|nr:LCP family protein [Oscillospiraceae bacterium]
MRKKRKSAAASPVLNVCIKIAAVMATLALMSVMVLNAPIIAYHETDGNSTTVENLSITNYLKQRKPMLYMEGTISRTESEQVELRSDTELIENDGLDLNQTIEGQYTILFLGFDTITNGSGNLHDVNYLIQFNLLTASMNILQIPRDSYMPDYTSSPSNKFNSIYSSGDPSVSSIQRVVDAVQQSFGIPVDAYVTTSCDNIVQIVDIIGGIPIDLPYTIVYEADKILYEGEQVLNGTQSEWFVRFRRGYDEGDIGRVKAQRLFLAAAMKKALDMGSFKLLTAIDEIYEKELLATDLSLGQISMIADLASTISMENVNVFMLPGEGSDAYGQSIWSIHKGAALDIINEHFRTQQVPLRPDQSAIVEWVPEGNYLSTMNDDTAQSFDELYE